MIITTILLGPHSYGFGIRVEALLTNMEVLEFSAEKFFLSVSNPVEFFRWA